MNIDPNAIPEPERETVATAFDRYLDRRVAEVNRRDIEARKALSSRSSSGMAQFQVKLEHFLNWATRTEDRRAGWRRRCSPDLSRSVIHALVL